ncbi:MAG TPA: DPP IV N-terminal domain-containing protein [Verrucomicrobiae bacterium]
MKQFFIAAILFALLIGNLGAQGTKADYDRALSLARRTDNKIYRASVMPHWLPGNQSFWYRVQTGADDWEYVLVDATTGKITRADNADSLHLPANVPLSTSTQTQTEIHPSRETGDATRIRFVNRLTEPVELFWIDTGGERQAYGHISPNETHDQNTYAGHVWLVTDASGATLGVFEASAEGSEIIVDGRGKKTAEPAAPSHQNADESPDGKWRVQFRNHNVALVETASGKVTELTHDGSTDLPYRGATWSPDSQSCVIFSVTKVPRHIVTIVESSPRDRLQPELQTYDYFKPGDELPRVQPFLIRVADRKVLPVANDLFTNNFTPDSELNNFRWSPRGDEFYFDYNQRGHQRYRILAVNVTNGAVRTVVEERSKTFVDYETKTWREWLDDSGELIWMSERDGWAHLWLYDVASGKVKNQITRGDWVVREVLKVDAAKRQIWFLAGGVRAGEDPYHEQLCRVNFDGGDFVQLTQGDGNHTVEFSPDGNYFIAKYSRVDLPTVTELRRSDDGKLICELEHGDASQLIKSGWTMPERFVAKGRDGATDIYGVLIKPLNFDPQKKYPVVEEVYAGPQSSFAPESFGRLLRQHAIAELGFIVVQADGMGTDNRGKKFHDVCWKNLQDAGFPDRIAWIKAAAKTRPWMDLSRVGIYGGSAGGQNAMRALLDYNDFYKVAVADCGCHDNRMDKIWWNEQWLGWPVDDSYIRASNVVDAHKLRGKLLLMVGELDHNVDPASTMQVVNALEKANKDFEMLVITGSDHGSAETPYGSKRRMEFLARNLLGGER